MNKIKTSLSNIDLSISEEFESQGRVVNTCTYCADNTANQRDHIVPCSWAGRRDYRDEWVWSCSDCNLRLSDSAVFSVEERAEFVLNSLLNSTKVKSILNTPNWSDAEISALDKGLAGKVRSSINEREHYKSRIKKLQEVANVYDMLSVVTSDRVKRAVIYDYAHTRGLKRDVVKRISDKHSISFDEAMEIIDDKDCVKYWVALKCFYGFDYSISNHKLRMKVSA
ncbi:hypothetical protein ValSw33_37 [Vibrio phage ValSw3-3]|nr:hypothetical protein ValSw33_37 [Vibrio phage ValSw3-3]